MVTAPEPASGLQHARAGEHVGVHEHRAEVLGVHDRGQPRHTEGEVGEGRPDDHQPVAPVGDDPAAFGLAYQVAGRVVAYVRLEQVAGGEVDEVAASSSVEELNVLALPERSPAMNRAV